MKAVIFFSGLAGLLIFGIPFLNHRSGSHDISVIVHEVVHPASPGVAAPQVGQGDCRYEAERRIDLSATSLEELSLSAGSGSLDVRGVEGLEEIHAVGRACASHEEFLNEIRLTSEIQGSTLLMETHHPDWSGWRSGNRYARLDLRIEVPAGMAADIRDGSGETSLSELGTLSFRDGSGEALVTGIRGDLSIEDGSGELEIRGVSGTVRVEDGSGEVVLEDVGSDVEIRDSSGEVEIQGVGGSLTLYDSSGDLDVEDVAGFVRVVGDSSGDIQVRGVRGDFTVERDGSGDIRYQDVSGSVDIPRKKGRR